MLRINMTRWFIASIAAMFLATGTANADCCDMAPITPAGHALKVAAKRQFGRAFSSVGLVGEKWKDCSDIDGDGKCVLRDCDVSRPPPPDYRHDCDSKSAIVTVKDTRYLGLEKGEIYLICNYRTKPVVRFFKCSAWAGD
jgi:hypothetical protein